MKTVLDWFLDNRIAARLLVIMIVIGSIYGAKNVHKEVAPSMEGPFIRIEARYPGAAPLDVEQQVSMRIEEALADSEGISHIESSSRQGGAQVRAFFHPNYDVSTLLQEIKTSVDAIDTFPSTVENIRIAQSRSQNEILFFSLSGNVDAQYLKQQGRRLGDSLSQVSGVARVEIDGEPSTEISIELSEQSLQQYNLSFDQVAAAIRNSSLSVPAGAINGKAGRLQILARAQAVTPEDFADIQILMPRPGQILRLGDIAAITDSPDNRPRVTSNGVPALSFSVFGADDADIIEISAGIKDFLERQERLLPEGLELTVTQDVSKQFTSRLSLLLNNGITGLALVFIVLMLFLRPAIASWITIGIFTAFAGTVFLMPAFSISLNMFSLFSFLLVIGVIVDDAIIVGESIHRQQQRGLSMQEAARAGIQQVSRPVIIAVLSTVAMFLPVYFTPDIVQPLTYPIFGVIALCLVLSLVEALLILPSHLCHLKPERSSRLKVLRQLERVRKSIALGLDNFIDHRYRPILNKVLRHRALTLSVFAVLFMLSVGLVNGGWIATSFMPVIPDDSVEARILLPEGVSEEHLDTLIDRLQKGVDALRRDEELLAMSDGEVFITTAEARRGGSRVEYFLGLVEGMPSKPVARRWHELVGDVPEALEYSYDFTINDAGADISLTFSIASNQIDDQQRASDALRQALMSYQGIYGVRDSLEGDRTELAIELKPQAQLLGLTLGEVSRQVRQGFHGEEIQRIPVEEGILVYLRYPEEARETFQTLEEMRIRTVGGLVVPLYQVADLNMIPGYSRINRYNRKRSIVVSANVEDGVNAKQIIQVVKKLHLSKWEEQFPGFQFVQNRSQRVEEAFTGSLAANLLIAITAVYAAIAIIFRSYWKPVVVLTAIPFGYMGAVVGHLLLGLELSMMSMLGVVATAGVVLNDNLVLVDRINEYLLKGFTEAEAVISAATDRFRPIFLTSVTTFFGLLPLLFETSSQARFLIPMVVSLAFGVLFATLVTLVFVPASYMQFVHGINGTKKLSKGIAQRFMPQPAQQNGGGGF